MIYRVSPFGCLVLTFIAAYLFFELKLYNVIFALFLLFLAYRIFCLAKIKMLTMQNEHEKNYEPKTGETYKVCPRCGKDVKRSAKRCPHCGSDFT